MVFPVGKGRAVAHGERADGRVAVCGPLTHTHKESETALKVLSCIVPDTSVIVLHLGHGGDGSPLHLTHRFNIKINIVHTAYLRRKSICNAFINTHHYSIRLLLQRMTKY